jgi:hypothetical protein
MRGPILRRWAFKSMKAIGGGASAILVILVGRWCGARLYGAEQASAHLTKAFRPLR